MEQTTNFNLQKPGYADGADIEVINQNMDSIDAALAAQAAGLQDKAAASALVAHTQDQSRHMPLYNYTNSTDANSAEASRCGVHVCGEWLNYPAGIVNDSQGVIITIPYKPLFGGAGGWYRQIFISPHADVKTAHRNYMNDYFTQWRNVGTGTYGDLHRLEDGTSTESLIQPGLYRIYNATNSAPGFLDSSNDMLYHVTAIPDAGYVQQEVLDIRSLNTWYHRCLNGVWHWSRTNDNGTAMFMGVSEPNQPFPLIPGRECGVRMQNAKIANVEFAQFFVWDKALGKSIPLSVHYAHNITPALDIVSSNPSTKVGVGRLRGIKG